VPSSSRGTRFTIHGERSRRAENVLRERDGEASCIFHTLKESSGCIEGWLVNRRSRGRPTALEARWESEACFVDRPPALFSNVVEESEALASLHLQAGRENAQGRGAETSDYPRRSR
jgi:hypothetical protein